MVDAVTKTYQDKMDQEGNQSHVSISSSSHNLKDLGYMSGVCQYSQVNQMPHCSQEQRRADMRFVTSPAAYPGKNLFEPHSAAHQFERRFVCSICGAGLMHRKHLVRHLLSHSDVPCRYICNVCGVGLSRKEHLDRHQLCHREERLYSCGFCPKKFKRNEHLSRHTLVHFNRLVQEMTSTSNGDDKTVEVITLDSDDEGQHEDLSNLKPVSGKPKNTGNNSDKIVIPKGSDVMASPSPSSAMELTEQGPKSYQCDSILRTILSEAVDTGNEIKTEFVTCGNDYQFFQHCDKGAASCVSCYNLLIDERPAPGIEVVVDPVTKTDPDELDQKDSWSDRPVPDIKVMVDAVTKTDPDQLDRKDSWSDRPVPDIKVMVDAVIKTDPDELDRKDSWSDRPVPDIKVMVDAVRKTDPGELDRKDCWSERPAPDIKVTANAETKIELNEVDRKGNWSVVLNPSPPPDIKDMDYLCSLLQLGEVDQQSHERRKQKQGDVRFITFPDGTRLYFCPECEAAYPDKNVLENHLATHQIKKRYICNVCGASLTRKDHLDRHQLGHSTERPYSCGVCSKSFKRNEHLSRHSVIHSGRKAQKLTRASNRDDKTVEVIARDERQHDSSDLKPVPDKPKNTGNYSDNSVIPKGSDVMASPSPSSAMELTEQGPKSCQCDSVLLTNFSDAAENEITQTEFVTCYNRVFDDHVTNFSTKMGDLIFLSMKEEGSYKQRLVATDKITCEQLREKEKEILKTNFLQVHNKYKISFATMFHDVVAVIRSNASTIKLQKLLLLSWFLKLFSRMTSDLLPEHSGSPASIWKKIIDLISNDRNPSPMVKEICSLNDVDFEKECWKTLDLARQSFC